MLKSQLQTTNFSTNFLSELPDELQEFIHRKVRMFVINELNALLRVANELWVEGVYERSYTGVAAVREFYRHPVVNNLPLNKAHRAINIVRILNKVYNKNYRLYTYTGGQHLDYDGQWITKYNCPEKILGSQGFCFENKDEMIAVLQANNIKYYKSWTKLKLYKALMSY